MKIVINACYGGFGVSEEFLKAYNIHYTKTSYGSFYANEAIERTDPRLIEYIETHGSKMASNNFSNLIVVEIPKGTLYRITEYDGYEGIETADSIDWEIAT